MDEIVSVKYTFCKDKTNLNFLRDLIIDQYIKKGIIQPTPILNSKKAYEIKS